MMETYIQMIRENYPREDHIFYFLGKCPKSEESLFEYGNVVELADGESKLDKIRNFYRDISDCDYIVWHCLTLSPKFVLFFSVFPYFLKKMIWVMWGIDLYEFNRPICSLKDRLLLNLVKNTLFLILGRGYSLCQLCMLELDFADFVDLWMSFWKIPMRFCDE